MLLPYHYGRNTFMIPLHYQIDPPLSGTSRALLAPGPGAKLKGRYSSLLKRKVDLHSSTPVRALLVKSMLRIGCSSAKLNIGRCPYG